MILCVCHTIAMADLTCDYLIHKNTTQRAADIVETENKSLLHTTFYDVPKQSQLKLADYRPRT